MKDARGVRRKLQVGTRVFCASMQSRGNRMCEQIWYGACPSIRVREPDTTAQW